MKYNYFLRLAEALRLVEEEKDEGYFRVSKNK